MGRHTAPIQVLERPDAPQRPERRTSPDASVTSSRAQAPDVAAAARPDPSSRAALAARAALSARSDVWRAPEVAAEAEERAAAARTRPGTRRRGAHTAEVPITGAAGRAAEVDDARSAPFHPVAVRGTLAAEPPTLSIPTVRASALDTGPVPVSSAFRARTPRAGMSTTVRAARIAGVVASLAAVTVVVAQVTAQRSTADDATGTHAHGSLASAGRPAGTAAPLALAPTTGATPAATPAPTPAPTDRSAFTAPRPVLAPDGQDLDGSSPIDTTGTSSSPTDSAEPSTSSTPTDAATPSASSTPSDSAAPSGSPTPSASPRPSHRATPTPSTTPSSTPSASATPTPVPSSSRSTGTVPGGGALRPIVRAAGASDVDLGTGTYSFDDFADSGLGIDMTGSLTGNGSDDTVLQMTPNSSSRASSVPTKDWTTNQLSLLRISHATRVEGFTLRGTKQGHLYNGLRLSKSSGADVTDVRVTAVPGSDDIPPGETFGINDFHTSGTHYAHVEVDGSGVSASAFGTNSSSDTLITDSYFHDSGHANGATFWQTRNVTVRNTVSTGNKDAAFNFERVSGTVVLDHVTMRNNRLSDLRINSDKGSAVYRIIDPVYSGSKIDILMTPRYMGSPNLQRRSDVHVIVDGVDRPDLINWVTHF